MNETFFTWNFIMTFAGAGIFTAVITEFIKKYIPIPTRLLAYFVALIGLLLGQLFTGRLSWANASLSVFNAVLIAGSTSGTYDALSRAKLVRPTDAPKTEQDEGTEVKQ